MTEYGELKKRRVYVDRREIQTEPINEKDNPHMVELIHSSDVDKAKKDIKKKADFQVHCYSQEDTGTQSIIIPLTTWKKWFGDSS